LQVGPFKALALSGLIFGYQVIWSSGTLILDIKPYDPILHVLYSSGSSVHKTPNLEDFLVTIYRSSDFFYQALVFWNPD
jgi:hypothetical protein